MFPIPHYSRDLSYSINPDQFQFYRYHVRKQHSPEVKAVKKLHPIVLIILHHHENYDGTGYPDGLVGKEPPILARIIRIVDSYDAMVSHRPYNKHLALTTTLEELRSCAGRNLTRI